MNKLNILWNKKSKGKKSSRSSNTVWISIQPYVIRLKHILMYFTHILQLTSCSTVAFIAVHQLCFMTYWLHFSLWNLRNRFVYQHVYPPGSAVVTQSLWLALLWIKVFHPGLKLLLTLYRDIYYKLAKYLPTLICFYTIWFKSFKFTVHTVDNMREI